MFRLVYDTKAVPGQVREFRTMHDVLVYLQNPDVKFQKLEEYEKVKEYSFIDCCILMAQDILDNKGDYIKVNTELQDKMNKVLENTK